MPVIEFALTDQIATITLNRPNKKNALSIEMILALHQQLLDVAQNEQVHALILTGAGGNFCSGGDLADLVSGEADIQYQLGFMRHATAIAQTLATLPKPVIVAAEGVVFGAGFSIALAADFIIASPKTTFSMAFARMGLIPDMGGTYFLTRAVGFARARELILSTRTLTSEEALHLGIILEQSAPGQSLARSEQIAQNLMTQSPTAFALSKQMLNESVSQSLQELLATESLAQPIALQSSYFKKAAQRFLAKETPLFRWE